MNFDNAKVHKLKKTGNLIKQLMDAPQFDVRDF